MLKIDVEYISTVVWSLIVLPVLSIHQTRPGTPSQCIVTSAETCFEQLFDNMPICTEFELTFRCHHFKVLDNCFRNHKTMCAPSTIGHVAKTAYRRKLVLCARQNQKKYRETSARRKVVPTILRQHPPSELQFISLFGYLQTQCHTRPNENCTNEDYDIMTKSCEDDIRQRSHLSNSDLDRHQLLRVKLDASSRLLPYTETKRADECLMVRSVLSDIFQIHQKYCLQTIVTRCMCERLNFEYFCDIECSRLEPTGLPLFQQLLWDEFKGRLASQSGVHKAQMFVCVMLMILSKII